MKEYKDRWNSPLVNGSFTLQEYEDTCRECNRLKEDCKTDSLNPGCAVGFEGIPRSTVERTMKVAEYIQKDLSELSKSLSLSNADLDEFQMKKSEIIDKSIKSKGIPHVEVRLELKRECQCGAKHTATPQKHLKYCPKYDE